MGHKFLIPGASQGHILPLIFAVFCICFALVCIGLRWFALLFAPACIGLHWVALVCIGSHWVALFINLLKNQVYFFDSAAQKPGKRISNFIDKSFTLTTKDKKHILQVTFFQVLLMQMFGWYYW